MARAVTGDEKAVWWERAVEAWPDHAKYQAKTDRQIPVFILESVIGKRVTLGDRPAGAAVERVARHYSREDMRLRRPAQPAAPVSAPTATTAPMTGPRSDPRVDEQSLVTLAAIRAAAGVIRGVVVRTPLLPFGRPLEGDPFGRTRAWLKPESLQPIGAFKLRGAYYNIAMLSAERRAAGVVAHSSGNHAQGVARAARLLGVRAVIVMPSNAPLIKVERVREDGAEIVFVGPSSEERAQRAAELARVEGLSMVAPYDDAATITGQGTIGLEIVEQLAALDEPGPAVPSGRPTELAPFTVLVPVGGGGIASGVAVAVKSLRPDAVVVGVEPALAADARDSLAQGRLVTWPADMVGRTIADGQRTTHIGRIPFALLGRYLDGIVTVTEDEIARAMVRASREARLVLEPSGATTLAAWLFHADELPASGRVVSILSGGNVDPARYDELLARGVAAGG